MTDWERIVARYGGEVWRIAYRILGDHADAADCFQNVFVAALGIARSQPVRSWGGLLRRVATCQALDQLRARIRRVSRNGGPVDLQAVPTRNPGPAEHAAAAELSDRLRRALVELPDGQAEVFCLRYLGGLKYHQIAHQLNLKTSNVGVLLHRARSRLRELLSPQGAVKEDAEMSG